MTRYVRIPLRLRTTHTHSQTLVISGKGKVANAAYWAPYAATGKVYYLFITDEESFVLPYVKPRTKEIRIISFYN